MKEMGEVMRCHPMRFILTVVGFSLTLSLVGCDYWPPALQAEIERLRAELQTSTMETTQLQAQVADLSKIKQELQGQLDELSRLNREKTGMITSLQNQLDASRARALKARAPKPPPKSTVRAKSASKIAPKAPANKSRAPKAAGVR